MARVEKTVTFNGVPKAKQRDFCKAVGESTRARATIFRGRLTVWADRDSELQEALAWIRAHPEFSNLFAGL